MTPEELPLPPEESGKVSDQDKARFLRECHYDTDEIAEMLSLPRSIVVCYVEGNWKPLVKIDVSQPIQWNGKTRTYEPLVSTTQISTDRITP